MPPIDHLAAFAQKLARENAQDQARLSALSACASACDCGAPGAYPHEPDCHSLDDCDEGRYCDKHFEQAERHHAYLRGSPAEHAQDLIDAGRGHLVRPV